MNQAILTAWIPLIIALIVSFLLLRFVMYLSGARLKFSRIKSLRTCQNGSVQSLSFVITLPIMIMIILFIVQISQLMWATVVINYAAFASARAASVWIPAKVDAFGVKEAENVLPRSTSPETPILISYDNPDLFLSLKYLNIWKAAGLACLPISPSRPLNSIQNELVNSTTNSLEKAYTVFDPDSTNNTAIPRRLHHKLAYSLDNTSVRLEFIDKDSTRGPTYNPTNPITDSGGQVSYIWQANEVGWQDPLRITVTHHYALLPGPGRFLAKYLVSSSGKPDPVSSRIVKDRGTYKTPIWASVTITNEGLKSLVSYVQNPN